jgi:nucleotide-binding universal stress UspA family protein
VPVFGYVPGVGFKTIIFATDFSIGSRNAGQYGRLLAKYFSCPLVVAHAFTLSQAAMEVESNDTLRSQQRKDLQAKLDGEADWLKQASVNVSTALLEGDPKEQITKLAEEHAPSIIVLGTHGGGRIARGLIGSVAEAILRSTRWPSLTVGPRVSSPSDTFLPLKRILYATDFTPAATGAAVYALAFAEAFGAEIDVLNVIPEGAMKNPDGMTELENRFNAALGQLVPKRVSEFCEPRTFVEVGSAHEHILRHIRERSINLLVLGMQKTSHLGLRMRKSAAFQLIVDATCPVLTIATE